MKLSNFDELISTYRYIPDEDTVMLFKHIALETHIRNHRPLYEYKEPENPINMMDTYKPSDISKLMLILMYSDVQWYCMKGSMMGYLGGVLYLRNKNTYVTSCNVDMDWMKYLMNTWGYRSDEIYGPQCLMNENMEDNNDLYHNTHQCIMRNIKWGGHTSDEKSFLYRRGLEVFNHIMTKYPFISLIPRMIEEPYHDVDIIYS